MSIEVKLANVAELENLNPVDGFDRWTGTNDPSRKARLRESLLRAVGPGRQVWIASEGFLLIGFAVLSDFDELPEAMAIEVLEVARSFRGNGIGTRLMRGMLEKHGYEILVVELAPQPNREGDLVRFYEKFGFKRVSSDVMVLNPYRTEKLREWIRNLEEFVEILDGLGDRKPVPAAYSSNPAAPLSCAEERAK